MENDKFDMYLLGDTSPNMDISKGQAHDVLLIDVELLLIIYNYYPVSHFSHYNIALGHTGISPVIYIDRLYFLLNLCKGAGQGT